MANLPGLQIAQHIQLKYVFGMNSDLKNCLHFHDEERIIYPAGFNVILHDLADKSQHYYQGSSEFRGISCLALSPLKRYLAVAMKGQRVQESMEKPAIVIFDTFTQKRRKNIGMNLATNLDKYNIKQWVSLAFPSQNQEAKYIISLSGGGGDIVLCWWWHEKAKCLAAVDLSSAQEIHEIALNPLEANTISVAGKNYFACFTKQESSVVREEQLQKIQESGDSNSAVPTQQPNPELKLESDSLMSQLPEEVDRNIVCQIWLQCDNWVLICTEGGYLILADQKGGFHAVSKSSPVYMPQFESAKIIAAVPSSKGFFLALGQAVIVQYEQFSEGSDHFVVTQTINVRQLVETKDFEISGITLNRAENRIITSLNNNQIFDIQLKPGVDRDSEQQLEAVLLTHNNHTGPINSMDICKRKPLIATCSTDKTIKIWDYERKSIVLSWAFNEEAFCISIHPQGFCVVVGFLDKLRLMNLSIHNSQNISKNKAYKEISPFKGCKEIKFSNGGQYFAAVNSTSSNHVIHVFKFFTGENPNSLVFKGHTGRVKSITWASDDSFLVSCGLDGMILAWKLDQDFQHTQTIVPRIVDIHNKGVNFYGLTLTQDNKTIVAVGNDRNIHQAQINESQPIDKTDKKLLEINLSCVGFPSSNKLLFAGVQDENRSSGAIRCFIYPLTHGKFTDYQAHDERGVEKMRVSNDDRYIITAGRDGCLMMFEIKDKDARGLKLKDGYSKFSEEVLITRSDLEDLKSTRDGLSVQINEYSNQSAMIDLNSRDDRIRLLENLIDSNSVKRRVQLESLGKSKNAEETKLTYEINDIKEAFEQEIQTMDTKYQKEVMSLVEEFENQKRLHEIENNKNNKKKTKLLQEHSQQLALLDDHYQKILEEQISQKDRVEGQINQLSREQHEVLSQITEEKETEVKNLNQKNLKDEQAITDQGLKAKGDISITKKKIMQQQQESQDLKEQKQEYERQKEKLRAQNLELREKIDAQKKTILERDKTIGEKEKVIYNQKKKAQDLEKFKFVLDHKIKELKRDIIPREDDITKMKKETNSMDQYLKELNSYNNQLGTFVDDLYTTQETMKEEIKIQRAVISGQQVRCSRFKDDVYALAQFLLDPEHLGRETEKLFAKYVNDKEVRKPNVEGDIMMEYRSQKKNLDKLVGMFKKCLQRDNQIHKDDKIRIMKDNVALIKEINTLRKSIKDITKQQQPQQGGQQNQQQQQQQQQQLMQMSQVVRKSESQQVLPPISKSAVFIDKQGVIDPQQQLVSPEIMEEKNQQLGILHSDIMELQKLHEALMIEHSNLMKS